jgi:hypothetical protein
MPLPFHFKKIPEIGEVFKVFKMPWAKIYQAITSFKTYQQTEKISQLFSVTKIVKKFSSSLTYNNYR